MKRFITGDRGRIGFGILAILAFCPSMGQAGIYIPSDPNPYPVTSSFSQIRLTLGEYRSLLAWSPDSKNNPGIPSPEKGSLQEELLTRMSALEAKLKDGSLSSSTDKLELTGCWLRTNQTGKVMTLLRTHQPAPNDPESILLLSHLAMAQAADPSLLPKAIATMEDFLEQLPDTKTGWKYPQWRWMRRAETVLLQLWKTRYREALTTNKPLTVRIDSILGLDGLETTNQFQPGKLPRNSWDKVDSEAEGLVVQLLYWLPSDSRLYWAYGELLNAKGDIGPAYKVLNELVEARQLSDVSQLFKHRAILSQAISKVAQDSEEAKKDSEYSKETVSGTTGEFPMKQYLNAIGLGMLIGAGATILLILQWQFIKERFLNKG